MPKRKPAKKPNKPGSKALSLESGVDNAVKLLNDIREHRIDAKALSPSQRRACLVLMANGSQTSAEMGALFGVAASRIRAEVSAIRREIGREVKEFTIEDILGDLALTADKCAAAAMKKGDEGLAWTIKRDLSKLFKELGVVEDHGKSSLTLTIESIGLGYEKVRQAIGAGLDSRLVGVVPPKQVLDITPDIPLDHHISGVEEPSLEGPSEADLEGSEEG